MQSSDHPFELLVDSRIRLIAARGSSNTKVLSVVTTNPLCDSDGEKV